jgi:hypothetical protein
MVGLRKTMMQLQAPPKALRLKALRLKALRLKALRLMALWLICQAI